MPQGNSPHRHSGPGAANLAIDGNNCRVFQIDSGFAVTLSGVTIQHAKSTNLGDGAAITNYGTLTVSNCTLSHNDATERNGGGISNYGTLTVSNSTISEDYAEAGGGGILNADTGTMTVSNSTISGNETLFAGGGIANVGTMTVINSTLSGNTASQGLVGGGIANYGTATVLNSTFSGNAGDHGGGIANFSGTYFSGTMTVTNCTLSGNSGGNQFVSTTGGGGIYNQGTLTVSNSTLSGNSSLFSGGGILSDGTLTVKSTILAGSTGGNCAGSGTSYGYNLSDDSCGFFTNATDQNNSASVGLDPNGLQDNGGPTQTVALVPGSDAIDKIPVTDCTDIAGSPVTTDQRGVARPQGTACDIGAFELGFSAFTAKLSIVTGGRTPGFNLSAAFTLATTSNGIDPLTEPVMLKVGTYSATVPAGSFKQLAQGSKKGSYVYSGTIGGGVLSILIAPGATANNYSFMASETPVVPATSNPVPVTIVIGDDAGTTSVNATFQ